jgi:hypothetical protein
VSVFSIAQWQEDSTGSFHIGVKRFLKALAEAARLLRQKNLHRGSLSI